MKDMPSIEVFPAEKTCEQGCPPCSLAHRGQKTTNLLIDINVQKSFNSFESFIEKRNYDKYRLYYAGPAGDSSFGLFPKMNNHGLVAELGSVNMSKVSSNTNIDDLVQETLRKIEWSLTTFFSQKLDVFRMTMVPENLYVGEFEKTLISRLAQEVFSRGLLADQGNFVFEIRSNLVPLKNLKRDLAQVELNNSMYLQSVAMDFWNKGEDKGFRGATTHFTPDNGRISFSLAEYHVRTFQDYALTITNRVIANSETKIDKDFLLNQAKWLLNNEMHFAIAPQGVMCYHTSTAINNPVLWMSHETFQREIAFLGKEFRKNTYNVIEQILLLENINMFSEADPEIKRTVPEWITYFDERRASPKFKRAF